MSAGSALDRLQDFKKAFKINITAPENNTPSQESRIKTNIHAVNDLLLKLIGSDHASILEREATQKAEEKPVLRTYNARTAFVEISVNNVSVWPQFDNTSLVDLYAIDGITPTELPDRSTFRSMELSAALGGVLGTFKGTVNLYAREPLKLLQVLLGSTTTADFNTGSSDTLPVMSLRFGWKVEDDDGGIRTVSFENPMSFLVTNIAMNEHPGAQGADFILSIQDLGSTTLQHTASTLYISEDYPQEQLRYILEKLCGTRLFTLDDLLYSTIDSPDVTPLTKTFFRNSKNATLRINSNTLFNVVDTLVSQIRCTWIAVDNSELDQSVTQAATALDSIREFKKKINESSDGKEIAQLRQELTSTRLKMALKCKLVWVPQFPPVEQTTSNTYYADSWDIPGAWVLLPDLIDSNAENTDIPIIYGPGGSRAPYLYGSAVNATQASINKRGYENFTFGDIIGVNVQYNSLIAMLNGSAQESVSYTSVGERLSVNNSAQYSKELLRHVTKKAAEAAKNTAELAKSRAEKNAISISKYLYRRKTPYVLTGNVAPRYTVVGQSSANPTSALPDTQVPLTSVSSYGTSKAAAASILASRVNSFIGIPQSIGITVLGDPFLCRQGFGAFELLSYYPNVDGSRQILNSFMTGVYMPTTITHRIHGAQYTTEISAIKIHPADTSDTLSRYIYDLDKEIKQVSQETADKNSAAQRESAAQLINRNVYNVSLAGDQASIENPFFVVSDSLTPTIANEVDKSLRNIDQILEYLDTNKLL